MVKTDYNIYQLLLSIALSVLIICFATTYYTVYLLD